MTASVRQAGALMSLREAIASLVHDGDTIALEGFTHLIPHTAGGPSRVVTDLGVLEPEPESRELVLTGVQEGVGVDDVRRATGWKLRVADAIVVLPPPTVHELLVLRDLQARTKAAHGALGAA
jgi:hypothetical protein